MPTGRLPLTRVAGVFPNGTPPAGTAPREMCKAEGMANVLSVKSCVRVSAEALQIRHFRLDVEAHLGFTKFLL